MGYSYMGSETGVVWTKRDVELADPTLLLHYHDFDKTLDPRVLFADIP